MLKATTATDSDSIKDAPAAKTAAEGFNYIDKTVIFRLLVNKNNIDDVTKQDKQDLTKTLGDITVTDTLPDGWEFVDIVDDQKFLIYKGEVVGNNVTVGDIVDATSDFVTGNFGNSKVAAFTFTKLDKPYWIYLKAKPNEETVKSYFNNDKQNVEVTNNVQLTAQNCGKVNAPSSQKVQIQRQVLSKTVPNKAENGVLTWTIEYKPYNIKTNYPEIKDTLPIGIDLRTDASGALDLTDGNIMVKELVDLNVDGKYRDGDNVELKLNENIFYDNTSRILTFKIPNSQQAYRLAYKTDVTGESGQITNKVELTGASQNFAPVVSSYVVQDSDASATMQRSGWIEITKQDADSGKLANAEFTLYAKENDTVIRTGKTNTQGKLALRGLPVGEYRLKETAAPEGYNKSDTIYNVTVTKEGDTINTSIDGKTGNDSHKITINNIKSGTVGNLTIVKNLAGNAAKKDKDFNFSVTVEGVSGKYAYTGSGDKADGELEFNDEGVATFTLKGGQSITIINLPNEKPYQVTEDDYTKEGYKTTITGDAEGEVKADTTQIVTFTNRKSSIGGGGGTEPVYGSITIIKVDAEDASQTLSGAVFALLDENQNQIEQSTPTGADGQAVFEDLELNTVYYIQEVTAPQGYELNEELYQFTLADNDEQKNITYQFVNTKKPAVEEPEQIGSIKIIKVDADDATKTLAGATFVLLDQDKNQLQTDITNAEGVAVFSNLKFGVTYYIQETIAPNGCQLNNELHQFILTDNAGQKDLVYRLENAKKPTSGGGGGGGEDEKGSIKIIKVDAKDATKTLAGATFVLLDEHKNKLQQAAVTGNNGVAVFTDLALNATYYVQEKTAPHGYVLSSELYQVTLANKDNEKDVVYEFANTKKPVDEDKTSGSGGGGDKNIPDPEPQDPKNNTGPGQPTDPTDSTGTASPTSPGNHQSTLHPQDPVITTPGELGRQPVELSDQPNGHQVDKLNDVVNVETKDDATNILPKTGQNSYLVFYLLGIAMLILGLGLRRKQM